MTTNDYVEILERVQEFYGELYQSGGVDEGSLEEVLDSVESELGEMDRGWSSFARGRCSRQRERQSRGREGNAEKGRQIGRAHV